MKSCFHVRHNTLVDILYLEIYNLSLIYCLFFKCVLINNSKTWYWIGDWVGKIKQKELFTKSPFNRPILNSHKLIIKLNIFELTLQSKIFQVC